MTPSPATIILHHGTKLHRAQRIIANGPDPYYVEPGSVERFDDPGFSARVIEVKVDALGTPEQYARLKAGNFPHEGGAVILEMEVPSEVIAVLQADFLSEAVLLSGDACFLPTIGMKELLAAWPTIVKRVIVL